MRLICPECKNEVSLSNYPDLAVGHVVECDVCGVTLEVSDMSTDNITSAVVDEGK